MKRFGIGLTVGAVLVGLLLALAPSASARCNQYFDGYTLKTKCDKTTPTGGRGGGPHVPTYDDLFNNIDWNEVNRSGAGAGLGIAVAACVGRPEGCQREPDPLPRVTPGVILTAFHSVPVPKLRSVSQPGDKTLVNFDTIFYTDTPDVRRSVTLLGQRVDFDITPIRFAWHHGDGTTSSTAGPGAPYPDKSITYRYQEAHVTVAHFVVVTWGARFRVNGGAWGQVPGTVTTTGPATGLRIAEATPVLAASR